MKKTEPYTDEITEKDLDRAYETGMDCGINVGVRFLRQQAAEAYMNKKDELAQTLRRLADDLENRLRTKNLDGG